MSLFIRLVALEMETVNLVSRGASVLWLNCAVAQRHFHWSAGSPQEPICVRLATRIKRGHILQEAGYLKPLDSNRHLSSTPWLSYRRKPTTRSACNNGRKNPYSTSYRIDPDGVQTRTDAVQTRADADELSERPLRSAAASNYRLPGYDVRPATDYNELLQPTE